MFPDLVIVCHSVGNLTDNNLKLDNVKDSSHTKKRQTYKDVHCKLREFCKEASILKRYGTKNIAVCF